MSQPEPRPAMTMRQIREGLGHVKPGIPEATVQPTSYVVSCLPEGHDARLAYTITVKYRGDGLYAIVRNGLKFWGADGAWEYEPNWDEDGGEAEEAWLAAHRFGHDEALRLARKVAPTLTYRGLTVADVLDDEWGAAPAENASPAPAVAPLAASQPSEAPGEGETATRASTGPLRDSAHPIADADNPTHLRWGLNDVLWSDDDSVIVLLSDAETSKPYWLELDPERAAALREDLAGPDGAPSPERDALVAELLPAWEAVHEPGNVSDYLIGYANDEAGAKGAAEAWMRSQSEVTGRLEWVPWGDGDLPDGYDVLFELIQRHDDGIDTGPGIAVRRRAAQPQPAV